ncbi:MAG: hypothetical protein A2Y33_07875 [Spirochaetes bacterium GWF1_51_8]|nr:MAG: hypothetical protein A2Y33_07875 [Spirochaetes bacterium GWF1_51_8]
MAKIRFSGVSFHYTSPYRSVFNNLELELDCSWHTGAVGLNGRGKTTFLRLISGALDPVKGAIVSELPVAYFPFDTDDWNRSVRECALSMLYPYRRIWAKIEELLADGSEKALSEYTLLEDQFRNAGGYDIDVRLEREVTALGFSPDILTRSFATLSPGEKTRLMIAGLFLQKDVYPLIDEPTNHLDTAGREIVAAYLKSRQGFLCVSHDRRFLENCTDHTLAFEKTGVEIHLHGFAEWDSARMMKTASEEKRNEKIKRTIVKLESAERQRRGWSDKQEMNKYNGNNDVGNNKGAIGHKAAKMMKQALVIKRRKLEEIEEKKGLLLNIDKEYRIKIPVAEKIPEVLVRADSIFFSYDGFEILRDFRLEVRKGMRLALSGTNGSGKSTLIRILLGELKPATGDIYFPRHLSVSVCRQENSWRDGSFMEYLKTKKLDFDQFRLILGCLGIKGDLSAKVPGDFSEGEMRKIELAGSLVSPAHLFIWDEPLNYMDMPARERIEEAVIESSPTMIFVEHDAVFTQRIATDVLDLDELKNKQAIGKTRPLQINSPG